MPDAKVFKPDAGTRRRFAVPDSFKHPAKLHCSWLLQLVDEFTAEGELVVDPMAGSGTLMLATMLGRNVWMGEMEPHFIGPMIQAWHKLQRNGPMMGYQLGSCLIVQADARALPLAGADACLFSPPYEASLQSNPTSIDETKWLEPKRVGHSSSAMNRLGPNYSHPAVILTSPPYMEAEEGRGIAKKGYDGLQHGPTDLIGQRSYMPSNHSKDAENIGNLKGQAYWDAMAAVYAECFRVLKPGGVCIVIMKDIVREKAVVALVEQTASLLEATGFVYETRRIRQITRKSFWRVLQETTKVVTEHGFQAGLLGEGKAVTTTRRMKNGAPTIDSETALVFRKPC